MRKRQLQNLVANYWQPAAFYGALLLLFGGLLWLKLGTLLGGYSQGELSALQASTGLRHIFDNPINAPFTLLTNGLLYLSDQSLFLVRVTATGFGLLTLTTFYWLVRHWHGEQSAVFGTIVFGCSAWFLHIVRLGTPEVLLFLLLAITACSIWIKRTSNPLVLLAGFGLAAAMMYVPGLVWLLVVGVVWQSRTIWRLAKQHPLIMGLGAAGMTVLLVPLGWAIYRTPELAKTLVGLPANGWPTFGDALHRLTNIPIHLFARGPLDAEHWLGRLPILDGFAIVMVILGGYLYVRHARLVRTKLIGVSLLISTVLICLGGAVTVSILIPFIYLLIAAGIGFMLDRWRSVFPRNVIAQIVGISLMGAAVVATSSYGLRHYFVAWPNAPATKQVFVIQQSPSSSDTIKK